MTERLDIASRLVDALHDVSPPVGLPRLIVERTSRRQARQRLIRTGTTVVAAVVVLAGVLAVAVSREPTRSVVTDSSPVFRWEELPEAPIPPRARAATEWTGTEIIVWGGGSSSGSHDGLRADGAAFDPATGRWRKLAPAPIGPRADAVSAWTGTELIVWAGWRPQSSGGVFETQADGRQVALLPEGDEPAAWADGAAYDPTSDTWRRIPDAPIAARVGAAAVWTGEELVVVGGGPVAGSVGSRSIGAAYHPGRNTWRLLPELDLSGSPGWWAAWTGREVLHWRSVGGDVLRGGAPTGPRLFAYDPATDTWREADSPGDDFDLGWSSAAITWTGTQLVVLSDFVVGADDGEWSEVEAIVYDPESDSWRRVARVENRNNMFVTPGVALWTGHEVVTFDWSATAVSALDPRTGSWTRLPGGPSGLFDASKVVADDDIYLFGDETNVRLVRELRSTSR